MLPAKPFPGYAAAGWAPSPHLSQLGLQSDFLAGFLLFHITTITKTPINSSSSSPATTGMITAYSLGKKYWWIPWSLSMKGSMMIQRV